jgi:uncharacterized membrane protein
VLRAVFPAGLLTWWFWPWGALAWLLLPLSAFLAWFDFRNQGWLVTDRAIVVRTGWLRRATRVMPREKVQSSAYSYFLGLPVAAYGVAGYGALFVVAVLGIQPRWVAARWVALGLFAMAALGLAFTLYLTYLEAMVIEAWCQWCLVSAAIIALTFLFSLPGLRRAR